MDANLTDNDILSEAKERFSHCQQWESAARVNWLDDYRFGHGDSVNLAQWDSGMVDSRTNAAKPCFTVNRTQNYCNQIINDARQNKASIEVRAVGNGATFKSAEILEGICRHIEYISNAQQAYLKAVEDQVYGGIGYWRVMTDYAHDETFDQEIFIKRIPDALAVYLDPHIEQADGSDASYGFIFADMEKDDFKKAYPKFKNIGPGAALGFSPDNLQTELWTNGDRIRVAEYYRKTLIPDTLHALPDGSVMRESDAEDAGILDDLQAQSVASREVERPVIEWFKIAGDQIVDRREWPGKYIPIVRCVGTQTTIDGILDSLSSSFLAFSFTSSGSLAASSFFRYSPTSGEESSSSTPSSSWMALSFSFR